MVWFLLIIGFFLFAIPIAQIILKQSERTANDDARLKAIHARLNAKKKDAIAEKRKSTETKHQLR